MTAQLSVIFCVDQLRQRAERCLSSILAQDNSDDIEIIIVELAPVGTPPLMGSHPNIKYIHPSPVGRTFGTVRAHAVRATSAPIVAFVEEHSVVAQGWAKALIHAYELGDWAGVGSEMQTLNPNQGVSSWIEPLSYMRWYAPNKAGITDIIAGSNSSYRRDILLRYDDQLATLLEADILLQWRLKADGYTLYLEPESRMAHQNEARLSEILAGYYAWGQLFASCRIELYDYSWLAKLARGLSFPLVPFARTRQSIHVLLTKNHPSIGYILRSITILFPCHLAAALGQTRIFLFGENDETRQKFLSHETNVSRALIGQTDTPEPTPFL
jgi:hypothetical protein